MDFIDIATQSPSLPLLFLLSFFAATILPIGSEWLLITMILQGFSIENCVATASLGNYLGACTTYYLGRVGADYLVRKFVRISAEQLDKAKLLYKRYGSWSLLLSWLPVVGDPLCLLAGIFRIHFLRFSLFTFTGKFFRYGCVALLTWKGMNFIGE